jgi:hypothetical protein
MSSSTKRKDGIDALTRVSEGKQCQGSRDDKEECSAEGQTNCSFGTHCPDCCPYPVNCKLSTHRNRNPKFKKQKLDTTITPTATAIATAPSALAATVAASTIPGTFTTSTKIAPSAPSAPAVASGTSVGRSLVSVWQLFGSSSSLIVVPH